MLTLITLVSLVVVEGRGKGGAANGGGNSWRGGESEVYILQYPGEVTNDHCSRCVPQQSRGWAGGRRLGR